MGRLHRRLSQEECKAYCLNEVDCPQEQDCEELTACIRECSSAGNRSNSSAGNHSNSSPGNHSKLPTYLIIIFSVVAAAFFVLCCYAIYVKFFSSRNRSRRRLLSSSSRQQQQQQAQEDTTRDEFLDEEHGPLVDHPIWYIRTPGLHQSIIKAITVCKYKRGEGLVEGTECSVCLSEFQEDESLRLLPKCNHAFHLPCIDTWLRSHTNCPMCRAPIVTNPAATRIPSMEPNVVDSSSLEGATQMGSLENSVGGDGDGGAGAELRNGSVEEEQVEVEGGGRRVCENEGSAAEVANMQPRRSLSLDSSSAAKISAALATVVSSVQESHGNSKRQIGEAPNELVVSKRFVAARGSSSSSSSRTRNLQSAPGSMKRSRSFNGKHLMSWYSRSSQKKPSAPVRSF